MLLNDLVRVVSLQLGDTPKYKLLIKMSKLFVMWQGVLDSNFRNGRVRVRHSTQYVVYDNTNNYHISQNLTIFSPLLPNRARIRARFFVREKSVGLIFLA